VFLPDGTNYAEKMIRDGYAREYPYQSQAYNYQAVLRQLKLSRRAEGFGLQILVVVARDNQQSKTVRILQPQPSTTLK
jgi:endonuclease YncB( thermonuclease family)